MRACCKKIYKPNWREGNGRPKGSGTKADCIRMTGISKSTVLKWWDKE